MVTFYHLLNKLINAVLKVICQTIMNETRTLRTKQDYKFFIDERYL
jgi:hypothetical protein